MLQVCVNNMYDLLLPTDIKGLKVLNRMPCGMKRCHINIQLRASGFSKEYIWPFVTTRD